MKIISYSDLHLEFGHSFILPAEADTDLLILAGDIITFKDFSPLSDLLKNWSKPVFYITGNHEYYNGQPMMEEETRFKIWLEKECPQVTLLLNDHISLHNLNIFGGTMWTDFCQNNPNAMEIARHQMNDFRLIHTAQGKQFMPQDTIELHNDFREKLITWLETPLAGARIVISHHAPVINPNTQYGNSPLQPAFNALDMIEIIETYKPDLWIYGHTHECDDQMIGKTRIISNQRGYPKSSGAYECTGFDEGGLLIELPDNRKC